MNNSLPQVHEQYEALPYPPREPAEERQRLVTTWLDSLAMINHYCFAGEQDFKDGFSVLVVLESVWSTGCVLGYGMQSWIIALAAYITTVLTPFRGEPIDGAYTFTPFSSLLWFGTTKIVSPAAYEILAIGSLLWAGMLVSVYLWSIDGFGQYYLPFCF